MWNLAIILGFVVALGFAVFGTALRIEMRAKREFKARVRKNRLRELERWFDATYRD